MHPTKVGCYHRAAKAGEKSVRLSMTVTSVILRSITKDPVGVSC